tara:strand:+ start:50 stop:262 length:213 start_codon:yes stop_codon:yes gene_type:complete
MEIILKSKIKLEFTRTETAYLVDTVSFMINHLKGLKIITKDKKQDNLVKNLILIGNKINKKLLKEIKEGK